MKLNIPRATALQMLAESESFREFIVDNFVGIDNVSQTATEEFKDRIRFIKMASPIQAIKVVREAFGTSEEAVARLAAKDFGIVFGDNFGLLDAKRFVERL